LSVNKPEIGALIVAKPDATAMQIDFARKQIVKFGFEIIDEKNVKLGKEQAKAFYGGDLKWIRNLGHKIISSCEKAELDIVGHYGTKDPEKLGKMGLEWNVEYFISGFITVFLVEANGRGSEDFFSNIEDLVAHLRSLFSTDKPEDANREKRAWRTVFHLSRTPDEFDKQFPLFFSGE